MTSVSKTRADAYAHFRKWLGEQPHWLQDASYRIYHGQAIDDRQIQIYVEMCVAEIRREQCTFKHVNVADIEARKPAARITFLISSPIP